MIAALHHTDARAVIEDEIERLIGLLDRLDGDPDCEPSLGWTRTMAIGGTADVEDAYAIPLYGAVEPREAVR